jgi:hypothetical protein
VQEHWASDFSVLISKIESAVGEAEIRKQRTLKKQKIAALAPLEDSTWLAIRSNPGIETLKKFLDDFPDGAHSSQAKRLLKNLADQAAKARSDQISEKWEEASRRTLLLAGGVVALGIAGALGWLWETQPGLRQRDVLRSLHPLGRAKGT